MITRQQVEAADSERVGAMIDADVERLSVLFSDDLLWVHASGVVDTKPSMLEQFASGAMRCFAIDRSDVRVRLFGDVAIMTGALTMDAQARGIRKTVRSRFTGVWRAETSELRLISWQSGRLPEADVAHRPTADAAAGVSGQGR